MQEKKSSHFIFTTVIGGLIFLVPIVVLALVIAKAMGFMMVVAQPMAEWLPIDTIGGVALANVLAILALIVACFLAGLLARQALAEAQDLSESLAPPQPNTGRSVIAATAASSVQPSRIGSCGAGTP